MPNSALRGINLMESRSLSTKIFVFIIRIVVRFHRRSIRCDTADKVDPNTHNVTDHVQLFDEVLFRSSDDEFLDFDEEEDFTNSKDPPWLAKIENNKDSTKFNILHYNVNSINRVEKSLGVKSILDKGLVDMFVVQESKLCPLDPYICQKDYTMYRRDRNRVFLKEKYQVCVEGLSLKKRIKYSKNH
jgi:hypothetical protein